MAKYRIKKGYFRPPTKGVLLVKVFVVQKRFIWGIWFNVKHEDAIDGYYFSTARHAIKVLNYLIDPP